MGNTLITSPDQVSRTCIVIFGATSLLAQHCCKLLLTGKHSLILVGRNTARVGAVQQDLEARGADISVVIADLDNVGAHDALLEQIGHADSFWFFSGFLPDQSQCEASWEASHKAIVGNGLSTLSLLTSLANICEQRATGSFVVVSSVAGDRGRSSNYVYGAAKAALSAFCEGLRGRLHKAGINVLLVKPGFFISPMTENVEKKPAVLWVDAERVAKDIVQAWYSGKNSIYSPWFWRPIMRIIREIPVTLFKRLGL